MSIVDLEKLLQNESINDDHPIELEEIIVTAPNPYPEKTIQERIEALKWSTTQSNSYGNSGRYNKAGRITDQFYPDDFLKWYYGIK